MGAIAAVAAIGSVLMLLIGFLLLLALWRKAEERGADYDLTLRIRFPSPTLDIRIAKCSQVSTQQSVVPASEPYRLRHGGALEGDSEKG
jgi:hypothetical protein